MQQHRKWRTLAGLVLAGFIVGPAAADMGAAVAGNAGIPRAARSSRGSGYLGFQHKLEHAVGLTPEQSEAVRGLLAQQHESLRSLGEERNTKAQGLQDATDAKIRDLLSSEQQKKFDALVAQQKQARASKSHRSSSY